MMLRVSRDGGRTWGQERWTSLGAIGEYKKAVRFNRLGSGRVMVVELSVTDPIDVSITGAAFEIAPGRN